MGVIRNTDGYISKKVPGLTWAQANPERLKQNARKWYLANRGRLNAVRNARASAWNKAHPQEVKHQYRLRKAKDPQSIRDTNKRWRENNAERAKMLGKQVADKFRLKYPWYDSWQGARQRCTNPNHPSYERYGGKGITFNLTKGDVAFLWQRDNASSMERPSIDRTDPSKGYTLDNCSFMEISANSRKVGFDNWIKRLRAESMSANAPAPT